MLSELRKVIPITIEINIVTDPEKLVASEKSRLIYYLDNFQTYVEQGYEPILRFPDGLNPRNFDPKLSDVQQIMFLEVSNHLHALTDFTGQLISEWNNLKKRGVENVLASLIGFPINKSFTIIPSTIGPNAGFHENNGPCYFRLPSLIESKQLEVAKTRYSLGKPLEPIQLLVHELLCHGGTLDARKNSAIDEENEHVSSHAQASKECAMDLLGAAILKRCGYIKSVSEYNAQIWMSEEIKTAVECLWYENPEDSDSSKLNYEGNFIGFIKAIEEMLEKNNIK